MKAIASRVLIGPSDCNRVMYVWPSTVGPKANERRSKGRAALKLLQTTTRVWTSGQESGWEFSLGLSTDRTLPSDTLQQRFSPDRATSEIGFVGETLVFLANDSSNFRDTSDIILDPRNHRIVAQV